MQEFYSRHRKVALMFSGGKDSIVCLDLIKEYVERTVIIWNNTGANFPEIVDYMEKVKAKVPFFYEIKTNQPKSIAENGYPVDVLPLNFTELGQAVTTKKTIKLRSYFDCCAENFWFPCNEVVKSLGITGIIRGQRLAESHKAPIRSGYQEDGIEYFFPIESWSDAQVVDYLESHDLLDDERLKMGHSSLDCWNCTAYLGDSEDRMKYVKSKHPEKFAELKIILKEINDAIKIETNGISKVLEI
jgi:phosphoadenosine phosphosulfate reductase